MRELFICPHCGTENVGIRPEDEDTAAARYETYNRCIKCGTALVDKDRISSEELRRRYLGPVKKTGDWSSVPPQVLELFDQDIPIATTDDFPGRHVTSFIGDVSAECVFGVNILSESVSSFSDVFGGRNATLEGYFRSAREECFKELRRNALLQNADAIVGLKLDYDEISGGGRLMIVLIANGTAVRLAPETDA